MGLKDSVTSKKSPNVYKSYPKIISLEKWMILTPLQKLPKNVGDLGKLIVAQSLWKVAQGPINRPIWSQCLKITYFNEPWKWKSVFTGLLHKEKEAKHWPLLF